MRKIIINIIGGMILAGLSSLPALADNHSALPGTVNYVEGNVTLGDQTLNAKSVGSETLQPGQTLVTNNGKAEMLLTPGVFVRLGDNSAVELVSGDLTNTQVEVDRGSAMVEVDELHKANDLRVADNGAMTRLEKPGIYEFDADHAQMMVFKGQAEVQEGDQHQKVKGGHEVNLTAAKLKSTGFDKDKYESSDLYRFSSLRSQYIGEASADAAQVYVSSPWTPGWFWDPWFSAYTFFPGAGFMYSPFGFGWGFYSPAWVGYYGAPLYYRHGFIAGGRYGNARTVPYHSVPNRAAVGRAGHFGVMGGGFHGGMAGGFHGSMGGGFHAGGGLHR
jgi:hypothetical protein